MSNIHTKQRIINAAKSRFHDKSYANVGIKEICDSANVQKGSFYHFFRSKRDLVIAVIDEFAKDWADGFVSEAFDTTIAPMERIDYLLDAAYFWQKSVKNIKGKMPGCLFGNLALEISTQDDILRLKLDAVFLQAKTRFKETLEDAIAAKEIKPLDVDATAEAMLAYLEGILLLAKSKNNPDIIYKLGPAIKLLRIEKT